MRVRRGSILRMRMRRIKKIWRMRRISFSPMKMMMIRVMMSLRMTIAGIVMILIDPRNRNKEIKEIISKDINAKDINVNANEVVKDLRTDPRAMSSSEEPPPPAEQPTLTDSPPPRFLLITAPNNQCEDASRPAPAGPIPTSGPDKSLLNPQIPGLICIKGHRLTIDLIEFCYLSKGWIRKLFKGK